MNNSATVQSMLPAWACGKPFRRELNDSLSAEDKAVLDQFASGHAEEAKNREDEKTAAFAKVAQRAEAMSGVELASAFQLIYQDSQEKAVARYREVLARLSQQARAAIERFAFERIRPVFSGSDDVALAGAEPKLYKQEVISPESQSRALSSHPVASRSLLSSEQLSNPGWNEPSCFGSTSYFEISAARALKGDDSAAHNVPARISCTESAHR